MKKILILFLVVSCLQQTISFSQEKEYEYVPFPTSDAIWSERYTENSNDQDVYERYIITGEDTIMNDLTYKKLFIFYEAVFDPNNARFIGGIREDDNKRVYYRGEVVHPLKPSEAAMGISGGGMFEDEVLLYDFSLLIGDTLKAGNFTNPYDEYSPWGECLVLSSIDTVKVGNSYRKRFTFEIGTRNESDAFNSSLKSLSLQYFGWLQWIEGIGNGLGLLYTSTDIPTNGASWLTCFEHNNELLYCNADPCDCYRNLSIDRMNIEKNIIKVYPNPVTDRVLYFEFEELRVDVIEIYNCTGMLIEKYIVGNQQKFDFSTERYLPGTYFYKITTEDRCEYNGKFIVR